MTRRWLLALALVATPLCAQAQDGPSPGTAQLVGALSTGIPATMGGIMLVAGDDGTTGFLLASGGMVLGPTVGNIVGGLGTRALVGTLVRGAVWVGASYSLVIWGNDETGDVDALLGVAIGGYALLTGLAVWDLVTIPGAMQKRRGAQVGIAPTWVPATRSPGLALHLTF